MPLLELSNVRKDYGGLRAVDDVSLAVESGSIVGLIGPNGSGKSTLINLIAGSTALTAGRISFDGHDISDWTADQVFRQGIARGYQDPSLYFKMTALDNALLPVKGQRGEHPWYAPWRRYWDRQEAASAGLASDVLAQVQLLHQFETLASDLSGGQMKLLEMARALMGSPKLLLLDEPTAGVAPHVGLRDLPADWPHAR